MVCFHGIKPPSVKPWVEEHNLSKASGLLMVQFMSEHVKIGLIADTHMPGSIEALWPQVIEAFDGSHAILHAGDLHTLGVVDELCKIAPTYVSTGNGDVGIVDDRLQETWALEFGGVKVGMIHHFPSPERKSAEVISKKVVRHFPDDPEIIVFGNTHFEGVYPLENLLYFLLLYQNQAM